MTKQKWLGPVLLFLAALIWGTSFVAQDVGADGGVGSFTYQATRNLLGALSLFLVCAFKDLWQKKKGTYQPPTPHAKKMLLLGGLGCGLLLCVATVLQQFGIAENVTSPGKDAFITALYIVFVPVIALFFRRRSQLHVYLCVIVALVGLWLLCMNGAQITRGDVLVILCSVAFAFHITLVDYVAPHVDGVKLSCIQFAVAAVISAFGMFLVEKPDIQVILRNWFPIFYSGVFSAAIAYTLQILGQKHTQPTVACLLMSLESVFAVISSMILLPDVPAPTAREWWGMIIIFAAIIFSQIPLRYRSKEKKPCNGAKNNKKEAH